MADDVVPPRTTSSSNTEWNIESTAKQTEGLMVIHEWDIEGLV